MTGTRVLSDEERVEWLQLSRTDGIGPVTFKRLIARYGSARAALDALPELARGGGRNKPLSIPNRQAVAGEIETLAGRGGLFIALCEPGYPRHLAQIADAPPLICVMGQADHLQRDAVAIVGARNASALGRKLARMLADQLGKAGYLVVSGLARGIDTAVHEAALTHRTAAVVAGGIDHVYPPENAALQAKISSEHVIVSEMPLGTIPKAEHFPRRNRIISGLSRAVIVAEAALRSGSLITARFAAEQGRDVFAIPGSPLDPRCEGANKLIKEGAAILTSVDDVLDALKAQQRPAASALWEDAQPAPKSVRCTDADRNHLLNLLSHSPIHVDDLVREAGIQPEVLAALLLELEVAGKVSRSAGGMAALSHS